MPEPVSSSPAPLDTAADVARFMRAHAEELRDATQQQLYRKFPQAIGMFPFRAGCAHRGMIDELAGLLEDSQSQYFSSGVEPRIRQLGLNHRRHGFPPHVYSFFTTALVTALRSVLAAHGERSTSATADAEAFFHTVCQAMARADTEAAQRGEPPAFSGQVAEVRRVARAVTAVVLNTGLPVLYQAGQHMLVTTDYTPGQWLALAPAIAPDDYSRVEFHVYGGSPRANSLSATRVGDHWTMGAATGKLTTTGQRPLLLIAHGAGWPAARSILFSLLATAEPAPPTQLRVTAEHSSDLYELPMLRRLERCASWLDVVAIATVPEPAWWESSPDPTLRVCTPETAPPYPPDVASREVLVCGPSPAVYREAAALRRAGATDITVEAW